MTQGTLDFDGAIGAADRAPLGVDDEVWCFLEEPIGDNPKGKNRATLIGCCRARITAIVGDVFHVVAIAASPASWNGRQLELGRAELWSCRDRAEHLAFGEQVARFWK